MENIFEQLPRAARWSLIFGITYIVSVGLTIVMLPYNEAKDVLPNLISIAIGVVQIWMAISYSRAAKAAALSEDEYDLETACRKLTRLVIFNGVLMLLMLILFSIGFLAALSFA